MEIKSKEIKIIEIDAIVENPKNANKHSDEQIKRLEKLIKYQGMRNPLIISNRTGFLVVGHGRLLACKNIGMKEVPVIYEDFESEAQEYSYLISDNEIARWAELDNDKLLIDLKELEIEDTDLLGILDFKIPEIEMIPECDEDEVPELKEDPITKRGDVWLLGKHRLLCGDSNMIDEVEKLMSGEKADMVFTDPPYGISVVKNKCIGSGGTYAKSGEYREIIGDNERFDVAFIKEYFDCNLFLWGANYYCHDLDETNSWVVWQKIESSLTFSDGEMAWTDIKTPLRIYKHIWAGSMRSGTHKDELKKRVHPTQKPVTLFVEIFKDLMLDKKHIVDLFLGSGSTLIACEKTNRKCYGMELDEKYCDVIINRWQNYTGKQATLESNGKTYEELINERTSTAQ